MSIKPKISIVIPVYNTEKFLCRCLDSVQHQTFADWQAICVNDGSLDNSLNVLKKYAKLDSRFKVINKKNTGVSDSRNIGVKHSDGYYVMFLDSDDFIHPQMLDIMYAIIKKYNCDMVSCRYKKIPVDKCNKEIFPMYKVNKIKSKLTDSLFDFATENTHTMKFWAIRHCYPIVHLIDKKILNKAMFPTDVSVSEDFPWWIQILLQKPRAAIISLPLYFYVENPASVLNKSGNNKIVKNLIKALEYSFNYIKSVQDKRMFMVINKEFIWPFTISMFRNIDFEKSFLVKKDVARLWNMGVFDLPMIKRHRKYQKRIQKFLNKGA